MKRWREQGSGLTVASAKTDRRRAMSFGDRSHPMHETVTQSLTSGSSTAWPFGDSKMAERIRQHDAAATPLGPAETWPQNLRTAVGMMLAPSTRLASSGVTRHVRGRLHPCEGSVRCRDPEGEQSRRPTGSDELGPGEPDQRTASMRKGPRRDRAPSKSRTNSPTVVARPASTPMQLAVAECTRFERHFGATLAFCPK
jgi:hypothetical protein